MNEAKLQDVMGKLVNDAGGAAMLANVIVGDELGLDRAMADGIVLLVEPFAADDLAENVNPVGRLYYAASTFVSTPNSLSQEVGLGLGAQAGEARLRSVFTEAGFTRFRRATQTPFNLVLEALP